MNKLFLATLLVSTTLLSKAQISRNQWLLGGELNLRYQKDAFVETHYTVSPSVGYFVEDKFAVGARSSFSNEIDGYFAYLDHHSNSIGPFLRYYFLPKTQKFNLLGDAAYIYWWAEHIKSNGFSIKAGPCFFVSPSVALEFTVGYSLSKYVNLTGTTSEIRTGVGFQIHLGRSKHTAH